MITTKTYTTQVEIQNGCPVSTTQFVAARLQTLDSLLLHT